MLLRTLVYEEKDKRTVSYRSSSIKHASRMDCQNNNSIDLALLKFFNYRENLLVHIQQGMKI